MCVCLVDGLKYRVAQFEATVLVQEAGLCPNTCTCLGTDDSSEHDHECEYSSLGLHVCVCVHVCVYIPPLLYSTGHRSVVFGETILCDSKLFTYHVAE